ncbi:MAG: histidinol dehydrogenase, partial [Bacteroidales bacterium]|nr:histidinol dehydrogenase [Bacteroidales bacterium]
VSVDSFMKKTTFQEISAEALQNDLGPIIRIMAENEQLFAHANAVAVRMK